MDFRGLLLRKKEGKEWNGMEGREGELGELLLSSRN